MNQNGNKTLTVMMFEFGNYLRSKFFIYSTVIICLLILIGMSVPKISAYLSESGPISSKDEKRPVEIVNELGVSLDLEKLEEQMPEYSFTEAYYTDLESMFAAIDNKNLAGIFVLKDLNDGQWVTERMPLDSSSSHMLAQHVFAMSEYEIFLQMGIEEKDAQRLTEEPKLEFLEAAMFSGKSQTQTQWYTYLLVMILYTAIMSYGQMTASSVATEKSNRAMELLITSTKPKYLIVGKVLGTGLAGLLQMLLFGLSYFVAFQLNRDAYAGNENLLNALKMPAATFLMAVVTFILSYLAYAFLFAALGSLVSRSEEVNQVVTPLLLLYMGVIFATLIATFQPDSLWVTILSYIPLAGTLIMFVRYSMLQIPIQQFAIVLAIHTLTVMVCSRIAVSIYQNGILRYGNAPRLSEVFKLLRKQKNNGLTGEK